MLCLKEINWYCQQAWLDLVFLSIYKDHLRKLRRAIGPRWIPGAHHIRCLGREIFWCCYRRCRRCIDIGLRDLNHFELLNHSKHVPFIPYSFSLCKSISWFTVSNAFLRSMKTPNTYSFFSKDLVILRTNSKIACSVEVLIWKPNCFEKRRLFSTK